MMEKEIFLSQIVIISLKLDYVHLKKCLLRIHFILNEVFIYDIKAINE